MTVQQVQPQKSKVLETVPTNSKIAVEHFRSKVSFETDPSDVYADLVNKISGILVIDARTPETYAKGHVQARSIFHTV